MYRGLHDKNMRNRSSDRNHGRHITATILSVASVFAILLIVLVFSGILPTGLMKAPKTPQVVAVKGNSDPVPSSSSVNASSTVSTVSDTNTPVTNAAITNAASTSSSIATDEKKSRKITVSAVGDCSLGKLQIHSYERSFLNYYDKYGKDYFFKYVAPYFKNDDLTLANLEGVLSNSTDRVEKTFNIEGLPEYVDILKDGGVDAVTTANNHIWDYGDQGMQDTWNALDLAGIPYAYYDKTVLKEVNGVKVGLVSDCCIYLEQKDEDYVRNGIDSLRASGADIVVVMLHWGVEMSHYPEAWQIDFAHRIIDWGADLIIGSHPHVLQGIEQYNGKMILYSEGNFCFGGNLNPTDKDSMIWQQTFTYSTGSNEPAISMKVIPCRISTRKDHNNFRPVPLKGSEAKEVIDRLNEYSSKLGNTPVRINDDGTI